MTYIYIHVHIYNIHIHITYIHINTHIHTHMDTQYTQSQMHKTVNHTLQGSGCYKVQ